MRKLAIVSGEAVDRGAIELGDDLTRTLRAASRCVRIVVHVRDLLRGLIGRVKVILGVGEE